MYLFTFIIVVLSLGVYSKKSDSDEDKPNWTKKKITDYSDADMERLLDQWNEDEEDDPEDLPEHLRPPPQIDMSNIDMSNPENLLKVSKKGRTIMTFVTVSGNPDRKKADEITKIWQTSLWNNNIQAENYMIDDNRAIFMFKDGSQAWEAKDFLIDQDNCESVSIENKVYHGKGSAEYQTKDEL